MKTMRIDTKPISGILLSAFFFELSSVKFFLSPAKIVFFQGFFRSKPVRIGEAMPAPLALRSQGMNAKTFKYLILLIYITT